jgi:hypothetical protein
MNTESSVADAITRAVDRNFQDVAPALENIAQALRSLARAVRGEKEESR